MPLALGLTRGLIDRSAQVVVLPFQDLEPRRLPLAREVRLGLFRQVPEVLRVPMPNPLELVPVRVRQLPGRVLPDRLQHGEPESTAVELGPADQAVVHERAQDLEHVEVGAADGLGGLQRPPAREHRQPGEQPLLVGVEELVAPRDRGLQRALAFGEIASAAGEHRQALLESRRQRVQIEDPHPAPRELERERQAVEPCHDLRQRGRLLPGDPEPGPRGRGAFDEQLHGRTRERAARSPSGSPAPAAPAVTPGIPARPTVAAGCGWWRAPPGPAPRRAAPR